MAPAVRALAENADEPRGSPGLGTALRAARRSRGLSLAQVAAATSISRSLLSLIETGQSDVTIGRLLRLAELYGVPITDFLPDQTPSAHGVVREADRRRIHLTDEGVELQVLVPAGHRAMLPVLADIEPGGGSAELLHHAGEEFLLVLEGVVQIELEGVEAFVLERGDSLYYASDRGHRCVNVGPGTARILAVATPPQF